MIKTITAESVTQGHPDKLAELSCESKIVSELMQKSIDENATVVQNQEEYNRRYADYEAKYDELDAKMVNMFDAKLWIATIDTVTAYHDGRMVFRFKSGAEIEA